MMHGREKSDLAIVAMKPANKANEPTAEASTGANAAESVERRAGAKGNTHQQSTYWTQSQVRVSQALARIRQLVPSHTRGRSRMRESRTYGSVRGACDETHVCYKDRMKRMTRWNFTTLLGQRTGSAALNGPLSSGLYSRSFA